MKVQFFTLWAALSAGVSHACRYCECQYQLNSFENMANISSFPYNAVSDATEKCAGIGGIAFKRAPDYQYEGLQATGEVILWRVCTDDIQWTRSYVQKSGDIFVSVKLNCQCSRRTLCPPRVDCSKCV